VQLHGPVHHREPDAAAALARREVEIEDLVEVLGGDAAARVFDHDLDEAIARRTARDPQPPASSADSAGQAKSWMILVLEEARQSGRIFLP